MEDTLGRFAFALAAFVLEVAVTRGFCFLETAVTAGFFAGVVALFFEEGPRCLAIRKLLRLNECPVMGHEKIHASHRDFHKDTADTISY